MRRTMGKSKDEDEDEVEGALLKRDTIYENSVLPFEKSLYERNRILFLIQSALLGVSYAIIWPTLWIYVKEFKNLNLPTQKILYGSVFVAYPISSMLTAYLVEKVKIDIRFLFVMLNFSGIAGNLIYSLNFHPVCLFIGRFVGGIADAFYVVIMQDVKSVQNYNGGSIAAECLCGFIVGLIMAQVLNAVTFFLPFQIGAWKLGPTNYPGLTAALLFSVMALANRIFLKIAYEDNESRSTPTNTDNENISLQLDMLKSWGFKAIFISMFSFIHTYVVSLFEILIPIFMYEKLQATPISNILLYGFVGLLYAMILMFTLSIRSAILLECFMLLSVFFKMLALLAAVTIVMVPMTTLHHMMAIIAMIVAITFMWSNDDVMYTNLIISIIPIRVRDVSHNLRKSSSKLAFVLAGVSVPFLYSRAMLYVGSTLCVLIGVLFMTFVCIRTFTRNRDG